MSKRLPSFAEYSLINTVYSLAQKGADMARYLHLNNGMIDVYGEIISEVGGVYCVALIRSDHPMFPIGRTMRVFKDAPGITITEPKSRGRPKSYSSNSDKQRAYRERLKGNPLRKYERNH